MQKHIILNILIKYAQQDMMDYISNIRQKQNNKLFIIQYEKLCREGLNKMLLNSIKIYS